MLLLTLTLSLTSFYACHEKIKYAYPYINENAEILSKNKVKLQKTIWISLDSNSQGLWKRIEQIDVYDKNGLRIMNIRPKYKELPSPPVPDEQEFWKEHRTNIPTGVNDTSFYEYLKGKVIKEIDRTYSDLGLPYVDEITTYKYDNHNMLTEICATSKLSETVCRYKKYIYDDNGRILYEIDSLSENSITITGSSQILKYEFKYDSKGNIIFDGIYNYIFDNKNKLIKKQADNYLNYLNISFIYLYDDLGNIIKETEIDNTIEDKDTIYIYTHFNDKNLEDERRNVRRNKLRRLTKYEYEFY